MNTVANDTFFMKRALTLAKKGRGWTNPNPMVGAVIVKNGIIIAEGYHKKVGALHAEAAAIKNAKSDLKGATLYVNLEPCSHFGRTPPCADAIIKSGIKQVVCSLQDSNPRVQGKGITLLKKAGITVTTSILEKEARQLNEAFMSFHENNRPFIAIKFAASLDGKIATHTNDSKWITNEKARRYTHRLRGSYQAILVGSNTVRIDNPHLGSRIPHGKDPIRIVIDPLLKLSLQSKILRDTNTIIVTTIDADKKKIDTLKRKEIVVIVFQDKNISIPMLLEELKKREIISVLVEGGGSTIGKFVDAGLVDKLYAFYAPLLIGGKNAVPAIAGEGVKKVTDAIRMNNISYKRFDDNLLMIGYPNKMQTS